LKLIRARVIGRSSLSLLLASLILLWPAFVNGQPFFMSDTTTYVRSADAAAYKILGKTTDWSDQLRDRFHVQSTGPSPTTQDSAAVSIETNSEPEVVLLGRSIYYGAILYLADVTLSLWAVIAMQAFLVALSVRLSIRRFWPAREALSLDVRTVGGVLILAIATPVAFFASYLMPDVFTALAILAAAHLAGFRESMRRAERYYWIAILVAGALFHSATILLLLGLALAIALLGKWKDARPRLTTAVIILAMAGVGMAAEFLFSTAVAATTGAKPIRPPFVSARLVADGPGTSFLRTNCPEAGFLLCRYLDRVPEPSDTILWSAKPHEGVFSTAAPADKRRLAAEDVPFTWAVTRDRPLDVLASSSRAVADQATKFTLSEFNYTRAEVISFEEKLPSRLARVLSQSLAAHRQMPVRLIEILSALSAIMSIGLVAAAWLGGGRADTRPRTFAAVIIAGFVFNVAICGALSTPHDRYSTRILWIVPIAAAAVGSSLLIRRNPSVLETSHVYK